MPFSDAAVARAERHVDEARARIAQHYELISRMEARGQSTELAHQILATFFRIFDGMVEHRDRLARAEPAHLP